MLGNKNNIRVSDVEKISGYSKRYIQRIFKKITGMNIGTYIKKRKLTQAAILLKLTKKKIKHISMDLNFSTQQTFTRAFLREFKVTPLAYRNEMVFDCSRLFFGYANNIYFNNPVRKIINPLKLKVKEYKYRDSLLSKPYSRANRIRLEEVRSILSIREKAVIITFLRPNSSFKFEVDLVAKIGYSDVTNYNYVTHEGAYWELEYNGVWEEYIIFGRLFVFFIDVKFDLMVMEIIRLNGNSRDGQQLYHVKLCLPIPYNIEGNS
ncbi:operon control protein [Escherichia coli]|nr:SoxS DNA-binding transcriptional dual regulator [Escherichia coli]SQP94881.1 operon control protein [Escherichia coli]